MSTPREESLAWDRVGRFLQQSGSMATDIAERNVRLWSAIAEHLKNRPYTADAMAEDVALSLSTMMDNMSDVWSMFTRDPEQVTVAQSIPTALLLFDWVGASQHRLLDPVRIEVGPTRSRSALPEHAKIALNGTRSPVSREQAQAIADAGGEVESSQEGVRRLYERLVAYRDGTSSAYILATYNRSVETPAPKEEGAAGAAPGKGWSLEEGLVPGVYDGIVYLIDPPAALASLRILVEGEPPKDLPPRGGASGGAPPAETPPVVSEQAYQPVTKAV